MATRTLAPPPHEARSPLPTMDSLEEDIAQAFPDVSDPSLLSKCLGLCRAYQLSADELATKWEFVCMNDELGRGGTKLSQDSFPKLEARCASSNKASANSKAPMLQSSRARPTNTFTKDTAHLLQGGVLSAATPSRGARAAAPISPLATSPSGGSPGGTFAARQDSGKVVQTVNPLLGPAEGKPQLEVEVEGPAFENNHFMWERMDERARLLDEGVEALEEELVRPSPTCTRPP